MGLFDRFKKAAAPAQPAVPAPVAAQGGPDALCAPVSGTAIAMSEVPDPVFSKEVLGKGCAVWPEGDVVFSPVSGSVTVTMDHAVGIMSESGIEVLVHVGVDTVNLQGKGFTPYVKQCDAVAAGQPLLKMDRGVIAAAGYKDCVVLAVSNTADFAAVNMVPATGSAVEAGSVAVTVTRA